LQPVSPNKLDIIVWSFLDFFSRERYYHFETDNGEYW